MHWTLPYIGLPYELGARGPKKVDCWGLVYMAYRRVFNLQVPLYPGISLEHPLECTKVIREALQQEWTSIEKPVDGCLVAMSHGVAIHHVGLYTSADSGRVLHCFNKMNVAAETLRSIKLYRGMRVVKFYLHNKWPTS